MTSRECVIRAMEFGCPDRLPIRHNVNVGSWAKHGKKLEDILRCYTIDTGVKHQGSPGSQWAVEDDFAWIRPRSFLYGPAGKGRSMDEWGCIWNKIDPELSVGQVEFHPLAVPEAIERYRWPDPLAYWRFDRPQIKILVLCHINF